MKIKLDFIFCGLLFAAGLQAQQAEWIYSVDGSCWQKSAKIKVEAQTGESSADILIKNEKAQVIDGFGGCFNELGWDALSTLPEAKRNEALHRLFSPQEANFTYNRMPMGASDYALSYYSFNDVAGDFGMANFNIDRDRYILIPYIRAAQQINPRIKIWASPWTPPAWMKTNRHYAGYPDSINGLAPEYSARAEGNSNGFTTSFIMLRGYLEAYALYFTRFIRAYEKEGIDICAVHVQNEPYHIPNFPSCSWRSEDLACFIGKYLGPKFEAEKIRADIYFGTLNIADPEYVRTAMNDADASRYIRGAGFQWAGKRSIAAIHGQYPDLKLMQTESECGNGSNDWAAAEHTWELLYLYLTGGANVYDYWNMALDTSGTSAWGWKQNALISVDRATGEVVYNPEFFLMKHFSHFVLPGAFRLETSGGDDHLAFVNPDGKIVLILANRDENGRTVKVACENRVFSLPLKAKSFNTVTFYNR
ncbi:MAG: glycosyl hydrolase family 30 [Tannerella sp.]|jgi:glucosylceramidase|nr:glycosyl hydrolase family 30 [Tannerella sp.]